MECFVCSKNSGEGYLCEEHAKILKKMLDEKKGIVESPEWMHHCVICSEYQNRVLVEYTQAGYFCDRDINEEWNRYSSISL